HPGPAGHPLPAPAGALDPRRRPVGRPGPVARLLHRRPMSRAFLDKQPREVAAMFDGVSTRYDRTNTLLSFGLDRSWRKATRAALCLKVGERCLDLAAGTLVSTEELALSGAYVVGADLSQGMLRVGHRVRPGLPALAADALALPFPDGTFDAVTISF